LSARLECGLFYDFIPATEPGRGHAGLVKSGVRKGHINSYNFGLYICAAHSFRSDAGY